MVLFFFFSSRRRHTRLQGDWSSDVCSSDLTKCWKPSGSLFSQVAVVSRDKLRVSANGNKLKVVDPSATIQRYACTGCGVHMYGRIEKKNHPLYGFVFIPTQLSPQRGWPTPGIAALGSSL